MSNEGRAYGTVLLTLSSQPAQTSENQISILWLKVLEPGAKQAHQCLICEIPQ